MITIIFSKDRANQLNNCIRSFVDHVHVRSNTYVIYKASNEDFQKGYDKCIERYPYIKFLKEENFKQDLISIFDTEPPEQQHVMFLVDDIHFMNNIKQDDVQFDYLEFSEMVAISSRLSKNVNYCYALDRDVKTPKFVKGCVWNWKHEQGDWGYPMSVDGNIYKRSFIEPYVRYSTYSNPNTFEAALAYNINHMSRDKNLLCCYDEASRLVNVPMNRVQSQFPNRYGKREELTAEKLNEMFLNNEELVGFSVDEYLSSEKIGVHQELTPIFKKV